MVWEIIRSMKTIRGLFALFISYMLFHGWAVILLLIGTLITNPLWIAIGTTVILFWFGPGTPIIPLIIIVAFFIKRYILLDKSERIHFRTLWKKLNEKQNNG
ncbi:MAG: hypothetical protein C4537_06075 [Acholeplasma sp.]|nr:MAG: hypothetical protein C4537_06075 [Acholeplasma sp.]